MKGKQSINRMKTNKNNRVISLKKNNFSHDFSGIDQSTIKKAKELFDSIKILTLKEKYEMNFDQMNDAVDKEIQIPIEAFNEKLTALETIVKYLKEDKKCNLKRISEIIGRDQRNVWHIYNTASKKWSEKFVFENTKLSIPLSILSDSKLSALESLVFFLKESHNISYHEIATLLKRDDRTIWTVYKRAKQKNEK